MVGGGLPRAPRLALLCSLIAQASAQVPGPTTTDRGQCNAGCARSCSPVKATNPKQYSCKTCKRGYARQGSDAAQCNFCSPGYATRIDPSLPKSARRGFVACKAEPCKRCSACPQGTTSAGGARGTWSSVAPNGTVISTCGSATPVTVPDFNVYTTSIANGGGTYSCNPSFGPTLKALIEASVGSQGAVGVAAAIKGSWTLTSDNACQWTVGLSYLGSPAIGSSIVAASTAHDCKYKGPTSQTGGLCTALPNANPAGQNLCVAFTAAYANNFVLCSGMGVSSFSQVIVTSPVATPLPVGCNNTFGGIIAGLMAASLNSRDAVAGAAVKPTSNCSVAGDDMSLAVYTFSVDFYGEQTLEDQIKAESATPINSVTYTGGVCLAYPNANAAGENLCKAFIGATPPGYIIVTSANTSGCDACYIPTQVVALGVTTAQVDNACLPEVSAELSAAMKASLTTQSNVSLTNETNVEYDSCQAVNVSASNFAIVGSTLYVAYGGKVLSGLVPESLTARLGPGGLDLASIGVGAPGRRRRRLMDSGDQAGLFIVIYNMLIKMIADTASSGVTQADLNAFAANLVALASSDAAGLDAAFPLPGGVKFTVVVTTETQAKYGIGVSVLAATNLALNESAPNVTSTVWAGVKQAILVTSYGTDPDILCLIPEVRQAMVAGILASFSPNTVAPSASTPTSAVLTCAGVNGSAAFTMMTSFKGTAADNAALIAAAAAAPFSVCTQAYQQLCPALAAATQTAGFAPQQALCILGSGTCPPACPTGTWRNLETVPGCNWALGGYFVDKSGNATKCPVDTLTPNTPARSIPAGNAGADSCSPCATGTTTNGLIGAASCAWVLPGYSYSNGSATECPADTFANATRLTLDAKGCAPCPSGTTTFGLAGQAACLDAAGLVPPGKFKSGSDVLPCPPGTFAPIARPEADATSCWPCQSLVAFNDRNPVTGVPYPLEATESTADGTACKCPTNTYFSVGSDPSVPSAACVACPQGTTSGAVGSVGVGACAAQCKGGYWGDPSNAAYGGMCRACPTVAPGNTGGATAGDAAAPVPVSACSVCSYTSDQIGATTVPATCTSCPSQGLGFGPGGDNCSMCVAGFFGTGSGCLSCPPTDWAFGDAAALNPMSGPGAGISNCGGCVGGKKGPTCGEACPNVTAPAAGMVFVTLLRPTTGDDNCQMGCPVGSGLATVAGVLTCQPCAAGQYSPGTRVAGKHPVCQQCPPGSQPADSQARCKTLNKAAIDATEEGVFDEFD